MPTRAQLVSTAGSAVRTALVGLDDRRAPRDETAIAVAVTVAGVAAMLVAVAAGGNAARVLIFLAGAALPIVVAVRRPLLGWRIGWLAGLLAPLVPDEARLDLVEVAIVALLFVAAAARYWRPPIVALWVLQLVSIWVWAGDDWRPRVSATVGLTLLAVAVDAAVGWWRSRHALEAQTELTRAEYERRAVLEERARIAREMHDIVAHHLSLIAVQTSTAPYRLTGLDDVTRAEFETLNESAREALNDTRSLLGTLRAGDEDTERVPQPTLADLEDLIATSRRAGMTIDLALDEGVSAVRTPASVSAYRIVQEALSNAARHAPGASVQVDVGLRVGLLSIRVHNATALTAPVAAGGGGHGLTGMRERVTVLGGRLETGATADGGFVVCAEIPVEPGRSR